MKLTEEQRKRDNRSTVSKKLYKAGNFGRTRKNFI